MRICVFGAGAVGGHMAARLARAGAEVCLVARGAHLQAVRERGLRYVGEGEDFTVRLPASDDARTLGAQDLVISTVKAHGLPAAVDAMKPLLGADTPVAFAVNGIPWWYFHGTGVADAAARLPRLDPQGRLWREIGPERALGCVIVSPNEVVEPGVVRARAASNSFMFGEPAGGLSARLERIVQALRPGLPGAAASPDLRREIWTKLFANLASSPLACLTDAPAAEFLRAPAVRAQFETLVAEAAAVAAAHGVALAPDAQAIMARLTSTTHPPSMLQDLRAGRPIEIDAQLRAVQDLARAKGVATPLLDTLVALLVVRARTGE